MALVLVLIAFETHRVLSSEYRRQVHGPWEAADRTAEQVAIRTAEVFDRVRQSTRLMGYLQERRAGPTLRELNAHGVLAPDLLQFVYVTTRRASCSRRPLRSWRATWRTRTSSSGTLRRLNSTSRSRPGSETGWSRWFGH